MKRLATLRASAPNDVKALQYSPKLAQRLTDLVGEGGQAAVIAAVPARA
jgi:hypothetical protein